jgi:hypothetical protein
VVDSVMTAGAVVTAITVVVAAEPAAAIAGKGEINL